MHASRQVIITYAIAIVSVQICIGVGAYFLLPDWQTRGQFGDVFGAANALFSGLAFAGLIFAILLQREDLALQRTELELTRRELTRSAAAQEQSEIALRAQAAATERSATLAATNFLLDHYKHELTQMTKMAYAGNDPRLARLKELRRRESVLIAKLDALFKEISAEEEKDDATQDR